MKIARIIKTTPQYLGLPHLGSRVLGRLMNSQVPWVKNSLIHWFMKQYQICLQDAAETDPSAYPNFNAFFTRELKPEARPIAEGNQQIISPVDGMISQMGAIQHDKLIQAKGHAFSIEDLLGSTQAAQSYHQGQFATLYLSPRDYHRVHMPCTAHLQGQTYIPGKLFSVNIKTSEQIPRLFARNERVVCHFKTDHGPMAMVLVGAVFVAGIATQWEGLITPGNKRRLQEKDYRSTIIKLNKAEEMGHFCFGSTVIMLFPKNNMQWLPHWQAGSVIKMGQALATFLNPTD